MCTKALENARMEDKSLLGKPVKIKFIPEAVVTESCHIDGLELHEGSKNSGVSAAKKHMHVSPGKTIPRSSLNWLPKFWKKWWDIL